jgi:hypothetical protein
MNHKSVREAVFCFTLKCVKLKQITSPVVSLLRNRLKQLKQQTTFPREVPVPTIETDNPKNDLFPHSKKTHLFQALKQLKSAQNVPTEIGPFASSMLARFSVTRWTSYPVPLSGKTPSKAATFRLFFRV